MVDAEGFRPNVGIIVANADGRLLWTKRIRQDAWQFPQGGIEPGETPRDAMYRELYEELGLVASQVQRLGETRGWLRYRLPERYVRHGRVPLCIGQKQKWFLLGLHELDAPLHFDRGPQPEFDAYRWVRYWHPVSEVVAFKRRVYQAALRELAPRLRAVQKSPATQVGAGQGLLSGYRGERCRSHR